MMPRRLSSLASLVMLGFAIVTMPVAAQNATLTPELLSKMLDFIAREGVDRDVPASVANRMGLTAAGQSWPSRQMVFVETANGCTHSVSINRGSDEDILVNVILLNVKGDRSNGKINTWRIRRDGKIVAALGYDIRTQQFTTLDRSDAQKKLEAELFFWSGQKLSE